MSDNQKLAFHAWLSRRGIASNYAGDGQYEELRVQLAWEAWTTAVDEMRPRAAVEADRRAQMNDNAACISKLSESDKQDPSDEIDIADVRQYLNHWGCLAHPGVRALIDRYSSSQPKTGKSVLPKNQEVAGQPAAPSGLGFRIEDRAGVRCIVEIGGGVRPASETECALWDALMSGQPAASAEPNTHIDDDAVDHFAAAMKDKLAQARAKGRHGWHECAPADLSAMLRAHVEKGDPRDVANFCMFLWSLGQPISAAPVAQEPVAVIGSDFDLFWIGSGPIAPIVKRHGLRVGSKLYAAPVAAQAQQIHPAIREAVESAFEQRPGWLDAIGTAVRHLPDVAAQPSAQDWEDAAALRAILMESPEAVSYPNESWTDAYAEWRTAAIAAARAAKGADHG